MSAPRGYAIGFFCAIGLTLIASFAINTTVNPWRVTPMPWSSEKIDPYRDLSSQIRTGKAGIVRSNPKVGVALVGSSRVANGLDPENPAWQRDDVVNLGCSGGFFFETEALSRYALDHGEIELLVLGLDPGDLSSDVDTRPMGDFASSPLDLSQDPLNRELRYLFGISTLEASFETLQRAATDATTQYTPKGLRAHPKKKGQNSQLKFIRARIAGEAEFDLPDKGRISGPLNADKARLLEALMLSCRERGVRLIVYIHPTHGLMHARMQDADDPPVLFLQERRGVLEMARRINALPLDGPPIELWDFNDHHPLNGDPLPQDDVQRMAHWNDLGHYTIEMGNLIQARLMGWQSEMPGAENYGKRITPENFDAHLEHLKRSYGAYLTGRGRRDVEWKESLIRESSHRN